MHPRIFHSLPQPLFLPATADSAPNDALSLFDQGHYWAAAEAAAHRLSQPPPPSQEELLRLFHSRLVALVKLNHISIAVTEAHAFEDVQSPYYRIESTDEYMLPWGLRVLVIRLQSLGHSGPKSGGVGTLYELVREARAGWRDARSSEDETMWRRRLEQLGWITVDMLIEGGDLKGAVRQMKGLKVRGREEQWATRMALLLMKMGDLDGAKRVLDQIDGDTLVLEAVLKICEGEASESSGLPVEVDSTIASVNNTAIANFYSGHVEQSVDTLSWLVQEGKINREPIFNLSTCYELMAERAVKERKQELVEKVGKNVQSQDQALGPTDFKM